MTEYPPGGPSDPNNPPSAPQYGQPPQQPQYGAPGAAPVSEADRKLWSMLGHLGGIILGFISPLIVFLVYKDRDEFIKDQSTEALNFQITVLIAYVASWILTAITLGILFFLPFLIWIASVVFCIIGGMAANRGERYRYPFALRLVK